MILSECRPGFFGTNCLQTCAENFYGILCESKCDCNETQICHHECGCLPVSSLTNDSLTTENKTSSYFAESCPTSTTGQCINYWKKKLFCTSIDLFNISVIFITYLYHLLFVLIATINGTQPKQGFFMLYPFIMNSKSIVTCILKIV